VCEILEVAATKVRLLSCDLLAAWFEKCGGRETGKCARRGPSVGDGVD
jgi:hypothetical protein